MTDTEQHSTWADLTWRGLLAHTTDQETLAKIIDGDGITFYCGFDPTAPSLHLGNLVQLLLMRRLQNAGHHPIALVGGATGLIGDPKPNAERQLQDAATVSDWVERLRDQIDHFLRFEGENPASIVNNLDWTQQLSAIDFLRDVGKFFRVNTMLRKDAVSTRLASDTGINYTEFSYQILQAFDFLSLFRARDCLLQTGGSDQWGNLTAGIELVHKAAGATVHAIATPLILNSDGTKFGKSEGNAIWLDANMTSPWTFHQFWLNTADADVVERLKVFTFLDRADIEALAAATVDRPFARDAQKRLASEVTALVHGAAVRDAVEGAASALFGRNDITTVALPILLDAAASLPTATTDGSRTIAQLLVATDLAPSLTRAREHVRQGAVSINNQKVTEPELVPTTFVGGQLLILKLGKKNLAAVKLQT